MDYKFKSLSSDRRRYLRIPLDCVLKCEEFALGAADSHLEEMDVKDLSAGGILIQTPRKFELGDVLRVELRIPGWERFKPEFLKPGREEKKNNALVSLASVVRVEALANGDFEIGIRLTGVDDGHRLALERLIFETVKERKRAQQDY